MFYVLQDFGNTTSYMFYCQGSSGHEAIILLALNRFYYKKDERFCRTRIPLPPKGNSPLRS